MKETKSKKQKTSPNSEYDFSKKNLEHCMNTILTYLKSVKLTEKANVIEQTYYKHSDKVANLLNDVLEGKKNDRTIISPEEAAALQVYLNMSKSTYQSLKKSNFEKLVRQSNARSRSKRTCGEIEENTWE